MRRSVPFVLAAIVLAGPLLPHAYNVSPIRAAALFAGARFRSRWAAFGIPLGAHLLGSIGVALLHGDASRAFHTLMPAVYACFASSVLLGLWLRRRSGARPIAAATVAGSLLFFLVTNFAVWALLGTYPPTLEGLWLCYAAGLPYLGNGLLGDALWATLLFAGAAWAERDAHAPALARS
ncbi:MAG: DUF6580 family putative transport protein [Myxococcota bacterium]